MTDLKLIQKFTWYFGASVAFLGILFKYLHFPGATLLILAGIGILFINWVLGWFKSSNKRKDVLDDDMFDSKD